MDEFLQAAEAMGLTLDEVPAVFAYERDPGDEPYINLAIAAGARYLASRDNDLPDLMDDPEFRAPYPGLVIIDPVALLRETKGF